MLVGDLKQRIANISDDAEVYFTTDGHFDENDLWQIDRIAVLKSAEIRTGETTISVCLM